MSTRLILLVVVAGALAVGFAVRSSSPPQPEADQESTTPLDGDAGTSLEEYRVLQTALDKRELAGEEPDIAPEFLLNVSIDPTGRKHRVFVDLSESHGFYVETFRLGVFNKPTPDTTLEDAPLKLDHFADRFLPANGTLRLCFDLVPAELNRIDGDLGSDENWGAVVLSYGRVRETSPDPLPLQAEAYDCR